VGIRTRVLAATIHAQRWALVLARALRLIDEAINQTTDIGSVREGAHSHGARR